MNDGMVLKNIGMQLQQLGSQIHNIGMQISFINNNYGFQLQNIGIQISNYSMQIFNIGIKMLNINQSQGPNLIQMNNMMNNMTNNPMNNMMNNMMKNFNEPNRIMINNNNINEDFDESNINIFFYKNSIPNTTIYISNKKSINELFNLYKIKVGQTDEYIKNNLFLHNGRKINPNENKSIIDYGIKDSHRIFIIDSDNRLTGGPSIILKVISGDEFTVRLDDMLLNKYLIKYFVKIGKSNLKKQIQTFPNIPILEFLKNINDYPK